ncbi:asparaginase [Streptomyces pactum]|uniref:asparaginase n=1 Tax=Streptomyces pactum TaxID=68249 RepID=UPI0036FA10AA
MTVALFTLGGTIAMGGVGKGAPGGGVVTRLTGADLTAAVPGLAGVGEPVEAHDVQAVPSASLTFGQVLDLLDSASDAVAAGATGVVVTQGTDTLEETAFLADLVWPHQAPLVFTGAMRNPTLAGADGPANLLAAVRVAAAPQARELGVLVVFNDEVHAARWVRKTHSTSTATFASPDLGPVGHVIEGRVRVLGVPRRPDPLFPPAPGTASPSGVPSAPDVPLVPGAASSPAGSLSARLPRSAPGPAVFDRARLAATRVALYTLSLDDDGGALEALAAGHQGLVVAGFGVGHAPAVSAPVLGGLAERLPVVLTSRCGSGSVLRETYGAVGSEADLQRRGLINGGLLDPYKARVLLRLLLASGAGRTEITEAFARLG